MVRTEPVTLPWIEALAEGDDVFESRFGVPVVEGWAGFPEVIPRVLEATRAFGAGPWGSHLFFDDDGALVGFGGWKGPPVGGVAELGYAVAPERQGRGIATTVVRQLIECADRTDLRVVAAHTLPQINASTTVLTHCGFSRVETVVDPDAGVDGVVWRWELSLTG